MLATTHLDLIMYITVCVYIMSHE